MGTVSPGNSKEGAGSPTDKAMADNVKMLKKHANIELINIFILFPTVDLLAIQTVLELP